MKWKENRKERLKEVKREIKNIEEKIENCTNEKNRESWEIVLDYTKEHKQLIEQYI